MKMLGKLLLLLILIPAVAFGGQIFGCIQKGKRYLPGVEVKIIKSNLPPGVDTNDLKRVDTTDLNGSYSLAISTTGKCILFVSHVNSRSKNDTTTIINGLKQDSLSKRGLQSDVYLYNRPTRYDFIIDSTTSGNIISFTLKRR